jgi:glycosyltransferase involved in cell wall biosynthesis
MAKVAVITRTRDRPLLLERARASIAAQTMKDFVWAIINDGGDRSAVDQVAHGAKDLGLEVTVLHRETRVGMEAASNAAVRATDSTYVAIHDDDDSWEPGYLLATTGFLDVNTTFVGAVTHARKITERLEGGRVRALRSEAHLPLLDSIQLADIVRWNLFPPIAFTYRRAVFDRVGGYDETMEVLGDWDFNLRTLLEGDIGVVPEMLANYHVRKAGRDASGVYLNSVIRDYQRHVAADASYRNRRIREDLAAGKVGLGWLLAAGRLAERHHTTTFFSRTWSLLRGARRKRWTREDQGIAGPARHRSDE